MSSAPKAELQEKTGPSGPVFIACKQLNLRGVPYRRDEIVDVSELPEYKVSQLLNQRFIRPS